MQWFDPSGPCVSAVCRDVVTANQQINPFDGGDRSLHTEQNHRQSRKQQRMTAPNIIPAIFRAKLYPKIRSLP